MCHNVQNAVLHTVVRILKCLAGLAYEHVASEESAFSGLGTAQLQNMHTPISAKRGNNIMEHVQAFHNISAWVTTQVI